MENKLKYSSILKNICNYYGISEEKFIEFLKNRDNKYILLLILKNNRCLEIDKIKEIFKLKTSRSINSNLRLAEEKLLVNKFFREKYFELENNIEKNDITNL
jgi:phage antirepressor YoqD-like protein